jgi:hypothetical protein
MKEICLNKAKILCLLAIRRDPPTTEITLSKVDSTCIDESPSVETSSDL